MREDNNIHIDEPILMRDVGKVLGLKISARQLFSLLRYYKVFSKYNIPDEIYIKNGLFVFTGYNFRVTKSGVLFIKGMLEYIEESKKVAV